MANRVTVTTTTGTSPSSSTHEKMQEAQAQQQQPAASGSALTAGEVSALQAYMSDWQVAPYGSGATTATGQFIPAGQVRTIIDANPVLRAHATSPTGNEGALFGLDFNNWASGKLMQDNGMTQLQKEQYARQNFREVAGSGVSAFSEGAAVAAPWLTGLAGLPFGRFTGGPLSAEEGEAYAGFLYDEMQPINWVAGGVLGKGAGLLGKGGSATYKAVRKWAASDKGKEAIAKIGAAAKKSPGLRKFFEKADPETVKKIADAAEEGVDEFLSTGQMTSDQLKEFYAKWDFTPAEADAAVEFTAESAVGAHRTGVGPGRRVVQSADDVVSDLPAGPTDADVMAQAAHVGRFRNPTNSIPAGLTPDVVMDQSRYVASRTGAVNAKRAADAEAERLADVPVGFHGPTEPVVPGYRRPANPNNIRPDHDVWPQNYEDGFGPPPVYDLPGNYHGPPAPVDQSYPVPRGPANSPWPAGTPEPAPAWAYADSYGPAPPAFRYAEDAALAHRATAPPAWRNADVGSLGDDVLPGGSAGRLVDDAGNLIDEAVPGSSFVDNVVDNFKPRVHVPVSPLTGGGGSSDGTGAYTPPPPGSWMDQLPTADSGGDAGGMPLPPSVGGGGGSAPYVPDRSGLDASLAGLDDRTAAVLAWQKGAGRVDHDARREAYMGEVDAALAGVKGTPFEAAVRASLGPASKMAANTSQMMQDSFGTRMQMGSALQRAEMEAEWARTQEQRQWERDEADRLAGVSRENDLYRAQLDVWRQGQLNASDPRWQEQQQQLQRSSQIGDWQSMLHGEGGRRLESTFAAGLDNVDPETARMYAADGVENIRGFLDMVGAGMSPYEATQQLWATFAEQNAQFDPATGQEGLNPDAQALWEMILGETRNLSGPLR